MNLKSPCPSLPPPLHYCGFCFYPSLCYSLETESVYDPGAQLTGSKPLLSHPCLPQQCRRERYILNHAQLFTWILGLELRYACTTCRPSHGALSKVHFLSF